MARKRFKRTDSMDTNSSDFDESIEDNEAMQRLWLDLMVLYGCRDFVISGCNENAA